MGHSCSRVDNHFCSSGCHWRCSCTCCPKSGQKDSCPSGSLHWNGDGYTSGWWDQFVPPSVRTDQSAASYTGNFKCQCTGLAVFIVWVSLVCLAVLALALVLLCAWRRGWWCFHKRSKPEPVEPAQPQWQPPADMGTMQQSPVVYPPMAYQVAPAPAIGYPMPQPGIIQMVTKDAKPGVLKEQKPVGF